MRCPESGCSSAISLSCTLLRRGGGSTIAPMRVLYHLTLSPFSRKVRLVLAEKNLEFTLKLEKVWERRPEFLALNPAGEVPVLIEPDGTVIAGTEAIVEYLDEAYREKLLIGINPVDRAEVRRLIAWFDGKMNLEVTENLLGQKMMRRYAAPASRRRSRTRRRFAPGTPTCPIISTISAIWSSGGAGWRATISRSPTSPRRRICRASTISATCRGRRTSRPRNGTPASSRGRASARSWPTTCRARRRRSTTPTSISERDRHLKGRGNGGNSLMAGNFSPSGTEFLRFFYLLQILDGLTSGFSGRRTGKLADPNSECPQPIRELHQPSRELPEKHRRASSRVSKGAVSHAIAAIFATFKPAAPSVAIVGSDLERAAQDDRLRIAQRTCELVTLARRLTGGS